MRSVVIALAAWGVASCGVVGAPVPPENVGVAVTIEEQKKQERLNTQRGTAEAEAPESDPAPQGQDVNLPPLRPVGTR